MKKVLVLLCLLFAGLAHAATYYVATTGSDATGDGSSGNPYATVAYAVSVHHGAHVIAVRSGTYYLSDVELTAADNGMTIQADTAATPILVGGTNLATWATVGNYQEATLPAFPPAITSMSAWQVREVLVDNVRIPWARLPTDGLWLNHVTADSSATVMTYSGSDVPAGLVVANAELETRWIWDANILPVTGHNVGLKQLTVSPAATRNFGHWSEMRYAVRNTLDGMVTGSWYHDRVNGKIIVQTNSLSGKVVVVPAASSVIRLTGTSHAVPITGITLSGLTIRCTTVPELADAFGGVYYPGAIHGRYSSGITITNCTIEHVGGAGISFTFLNDNLTSTIVNNTVRDTGGTGIMFADGAASGNTVTDAGVQYLSAAGIYYNANGQTGAGVSYVTTNTVLRVQGSGIVAGHGVTGSAVRYNTVTDAEQSMNDGAWIYMTTMTGFVGFNRLYGTAYATTLDRYGIYLDDAATASRAVSNATFNVSVPVLVHATSDCVVTNNYFIATTGNMRARISAVSGTTTLTRNVWQYPGSFLAVGDSGDQPSWTGNVIWSPAGNTGVPAAATFASPQLDGGYQLAPSSPALPLGINPVFGQTTGGTVYFVSTSGNDSNPGTYSQPWLTVQRAANVMVAGDTVIVNAGTYNERVTESTSGTVGSRITYTTNGVVSVGGFVLTGAYVTLDGFYLTGAGGGAQFISVQNHNEIIRNISILKPAHSSVWGVYVGVGYTNCYIDHLMTENIWYPNVMLDGAYCTVTNTSITSTTSWDAFRIGGSNNKIVGCAVTMTRGSNEEHTDLVQCGTAPGSVATNNILENNLFGPFDSNVQLSMIDDDTTGHAAAWIFRNNIYLGPSGIMHIQIPGCMFYNNVFYHIDTAFGSCISLSGDPGWAYANNTVFRNNIWYECGVSSGLSPYQGWYSIGSGITGTDSDYNLVIGTGAGLIKSGFVTGGREIHSFNGANPLFVDPGSLLAAAYKLQEGSPAINAGTTIATFGYDYDGTTRPQGAAWDMGAYESGAGEPPDTTAPSPDPMTWSSVPAAISTSAITMVATTATDASSPPVAYYFDETSGHAGGTDSGWQASASYTDAGLSASTLYTYRVCARDVLLNVTAYSSSQNATTDAAEVPPPIELRATLVNAGSIKTP